MTRKNFIPFAHIVSMTLALGASMLIDAGCGDFCFGTWTCGGSSGGSSDTSTQAPWVPYWLKCRGENVDTHDICVDDQWCDQAYTFEEKCNFHWEGKTEGVYPEGGWFTPWKGEECDPYNDVPVAQMPCYPHPDPDTGTDGDTTTGGAPTTGADEERYWFCNIDAENMCFLFYNPPDEDRTDATNDPTFHSKCWTVGSKLPCVYGTESAAETLCKDDCDKDRENTEGFCTDIGDVIVEEVGVEMHDTWECVGFASTLTAVGVGQSGFCDVIMPVSDGSPTKTFTATVMATGSDGGSTSQTGLRGYLAMRTENCDSTKCDLVIEGIEGTARDLSGIYTDPAGAQLTYAFDDLDFRIMQQLRGEWYPERGTVTFPASAAKVTGGGQ